MADKRISELNSITGANTASGDLFVIVDVDASETKKITRDELTNALELTDFDNIDINGGTIDSTTIGGSTPAAGSFTTGQFDTSLNVDGTVTADGLTVDGASVFNQAASDQSGGAAIKANGTPYGNNKSIHAYMGTTSDSRSLIFAENASSSGAVFNVAGNGDISFYEDTGTTPKLFWDANGERLYIGDNTVSSNNAANNFVIGSTGSTGMSFISGDSDAQSIMFGDATDQASGRIQYFHDDDHMEFSVNGGSEAARIDSSGIVMIGTTDTNGGIGSSDTDDSAIAFNGGTGQVFFTHSADSAGFGSVGHFNRKNTDGDIVQFRKDGSTVGSIGVASSRLQIGTDSDSAIFFDSTNTCVTPSDLNGSSDDVLDLGKSGARWKDLYLSGGVVFSDAGGSGTATSNTLDSYEEGTWTPEYTSTGGAITATYDIQDGHYTKVGRQVTVFGRLRTDSLSGGSGVAKVQGLPFTAGSFERTAGAISTCSDFAGDMPSSFYVPNGSSEFTLLYRTTSNGAALNSNVSDLGTGINANFLAFSVTYFV